MRRRIAASSSRGLFVALLITTSSRLLDAQQDDRTSTAISLVRAGEEALAAAMQARDERQLDQLLAPDYVLRASPDIDRRTWIRNAITLCWGQRADIDRFSAVQHDQVVVASFEITFYQDPVTCRPAVLRSLITDIWVLDGDRWRLQIRHGAPPPAPEAGIVPQYGLMPDLLPVWDVTSELSFVATAGNTSTRTLGVGADARHRTDGTDMRLSVAYVSSEVDEITRARSLTLLGREGFRFGQRFQLFGEGSYSKDEFAGIDGRTSLTGGLAYAASRTRPHILTIEAGGGITAEQRVDTDNARFTTAFGALHYTWSIAPTTRLTEDSTFTADLLTANNWRATSVTGLTVTLLRSLSFKASHSIEYRNAPVIGFGRTDMRTAAALVFSFQRLRGPK